MSCREKVAVSQLPTCQEERSEVTEAASAVLLLPLRRLPHSSSSDDESVDPFRRKEKDCGERVSSDDDDDDDAFCKCRLRLLLLFGNLSRLLRARAMVESSSHGVNCKSPPSW